MSDDTINAEVAEYVMGWRWHRMTYVGPTRGSRVTADFLSPADARGFHESADWLIEEISEADARLIRDCKATPNVRLYTTDPAADYEVLKFVNQSWSIPQRRKFLEALKEQWDIRQGYKPDLNDVQFHRGCALDYTPGDYAKAAIRVVRGAAADAATTEGR